MKGLICDIYQNPMGNFSNSGISSRVSKVTLVGEDANGNPIEGPFEPSPCAPAVYLVVRKVGKREHVFARPLELSDSVWSMMGGCFIYSCDARFPFQFPIPLHDRVEA